MKRYGILQQGTGLLGNRLHGSAESIHKPGALRHFLNRMGCGNDVGFCADRFLGNPAFYSIERLRETRC